MSKTKSKTERPRMTVEEVAAYGGWTPRQVRRWSHEGKLPHTNPGRSLEFRREDVDAYCQRPSCGPRWWPGKSPHPSGLISSFSWVHLLVFGLRACGRSRLR